jgi:hypothetical protein
LIADCQMSIGDLGMRIVVLMIDAKNVRIYSGFGENGEEGKEY